MDILYAISEKLQKGKANDVKELVQKALEDGVGAKYILENGLISGIKIIGAKFKNNEVYVPEVLIAARAMHAGLETLKPYFFSAGIKPQGVVVLGTVKGDLHDIGKNLVKMMMEGKGLHIIDLGVDVPVEKFISTAIEANADMIACSALLTSTMTEMKRVVDKTIEMGIRDKVIIMVGGAPITNNFCKSIGADVYAPDATAAADASVDVLKSCKTY